MLFEVKPCIAISEKPQLVFVQWDDLAPHSIKKEPWHAILNTDTQKRQLFRAGLSFMHTQLKAKFSVSNLKSYFLACI